MAKLIGYVTADNGRTSAHRIAHKNITARLEAWEGSVTVTLWPNGDFIVGLGQKGKFGIQTLAGNVDKQVAYPVET